MRTLHAITAIAVVYTLALSRTAESQPIFGDDIFLTDPTPGIVFEDTDTAGWNWVVRGRDEFFHIQDPVNDSVAFSIDPSQLSITLGYGATSTSGYSIALGHDATTTSGFSAALGEGASSSGGFSIALGNGANAEGGFSSALGSNASAIGNFSLALGNGANAPETFSTALGTGANAAGDSSTALGFRAYSPMPDTIVLGAIPGVNDGEAYADVAIGTTAPQAPLHIVRNDATEELLYLESGEAGAPQDRAMMYLENNGGIRFEFANSSLATAWRFQSATGHQDRFEVTKVGTGDIEMALDASGNLEILGTFTEMSDREAKQDIEVLSGETVLERLSMVPISEWAYKRDPDTRHVGPMAQDFHAAFGLGRDEKHISARDMAGVSLAGLKALAEENLELKAELNELKALITQLLSQAAPNRVRN